MFYNDKKINIIDERDPNIVISLYVFAVKKYGNDFKDIIKKDMALLNYYIEYISIEPPRSVSHE